MAEDDKPNQVALVAEFHEKILIPGSMEYRNKGLEAPARLGAFMTAALAVGDLHYQEEEGRTLNEDEFSYLARIVFRQVRDEMTKGPAS